MRGALAAACVALVGCGSAQVSSPVEVRVAPTAVTLAPGAAQQFTATVTGSANGSVTWSVREPEGGSVTGEGLYTAPASGGTYHVTATSASDPTKAATASVTVTPASDVSVSISPDAANVQPGGTQQFTAAVTGAANFAVEWSVRETGGGTVTAGGLYTAPREIGTFHVVATSVADPSKSAIATVSVTATPVVTISISPAAASLQAGGTQQFTATVTGTAHVAVSWSVQEADCGTITGAGLYIAPLRGGTCHVTATSVEDPSKSATSTVTVAAPPAAAVGEEFVGPFPSWKSVKDYGAKGDGVADDTAAIQAALAELRPASRPSAVLFFPAGTYRITQTLVTTRNKDIPSEYQGVSLVGEDPGTTVLSWDGATGANMLNFDAWYAKVSRLTFDGRGTAGTGLYRGPIFSSVCELSDLVFRDMQIGIQLGLNGDYGQAEHPVQRAQFLRCSVAGVRLANSNSLDAWIWYSRFEDCAYGVYSQKGNFHVFRSVFRRSTAGDIGVEELQMFALVDNISVGSKNFTNWADNAQVWGAQLLLKGNRIYDTTDDYSIATGSAGPWVLVDNVIRSREG